MDASTLTFPAGLSGKAYTRAAQKGNREHPDPAPSGTLISEQLLQIVPRGLFPRIGPFTLPFAADEIKILAKIRHVLLRHGIGATIFALVRHARFVADAVEADLEVHAAAMAAFGAARQPGDRVIPAAIMAMSSHWHVFILEIGAGKSNLR